MTSDRLSGYFSLTPLLVFICVYLVSSLLAGDFYAVPVSSAFLVSSIYSIIICKGKKFSDRVDIFSKGAGHPNVLQMIWIFILAGAFAATAREIGAVDATVQLTLRIIPSKMLFAGLFITACFISMSIGTSVGTIVALVPIAAGISTQTGIEMGFITAIIVGGAFFGDNLSFISDTTIAATRAAGCSMNDKFKANILIVLPAVVIVTSIYLIMGRDVYMTPPAGHTDWIRIIPYLLVIVLAMRGINVSVVLTIGLLVCSAIGLIDGSFTWTGLLQSIGGGIAGMSELIIVTLLAGGMMEIIKHNGGFDIIIKGLSKVNGGRRSAEFSIAALVSVANLCTANNTIAILTVGPIAKNISRQFGLDPRRTASLLDTFSCLIQGLIPYGAQLLMASSMAGVSSIEIIRYLYYPLVLGAVAILSILLRYPRRYC